MYRFYVERKALFDAEAKRLFDEITGFLGVQSVTGVRFLLRYDLDGVSKSIAREAAARVFSTVQSDIVRNELPAHSDETPIIWEYLPGQYDQRADSAEQCLSLLRAGLEEEEKEEKEEKEGEKPIVRCAKIVLLKGKITADDKKKIEHYLINAVDSRLTDDNIKDTLVPKAQVPTDIEIVKGLITKSDKELLRIRESMGLAMDGADLRFLQDYFKGKGRDPTETEVRVLDTYWSDHCRHTTFLTELEDIKIEDGPYSSLFDNSLAQYKAARDELYKGRKNKTITLMDMAVIGAKYLRKHGKLDDLEVSDENNACSVYIDVDADGGMQKWILMFKNETHNHPTEIEPFGGAATCIGGAIRDPLSGRAWVYQAMRVTGAADPTVPLAATIKGKLPQLKLCRESAQGFSSYGNQIGLATGQVTELYHKGYAAKRMELGAVIACAPADCVKRETPEAGDVVILLGGGTGRDGIGGATGSSKVHTLKSVETCAAEVQKGNAVEERKIQRLFRDRDLCAMIRRSNDFGAGGVAVAVGELSPGLDIDLDAVPKKYAGLNGTELAISESQERMAVVVRKLDAQAFIDKAAKENLNAVVVAIVTNNNRLVMKWRGKVIVDLDRDFLDAAGAHHKAKALIKSPAQADKSPLVLPYSSLQGGAPNPSRHCEGHEGLRGNLVLKDSWLANISNLACCSERGLCERFDGSIGAGSVLFPFGGRRQGTPEAGMAARIPVLPPHKTHTVSLMAQGFDPRVGQWSPWHGAQIAVLSSLAKIVCMGGKAENCRLSFQEFFGRAVDEKTWGYPCAALLGALDAQIKTGCAAIGGKDSMSGSFEDINVPHTLVSFAVITESERNVQSGSFKHSGNGVYLVTVPYSAQLAPDWSTFMQNSKVLHRLNEEGKVCAMYPVGAGGVAEAVTKMAFGNGIGVKINKGVAAATRAGLESGTHGPSAADLFVPQYGAIVVEAAGEIAKTDISSFVAGTVTKIGETTANKAIEVNAELDGEHTACVIELCEAEAAWEATLSKVYPTTSEAGKTDEALPPYALLTHKSLDEARCIAVPESAEGGEMRAAHRTKTFSSPSAKPVVVIPVFPGTNCEYDMERAFLLSGADVRTVVFTNRSTSDIEESLDSLCREVGGANILALAGGFSAGDEPDGSGKFIANVLRSPRVAEKVMELLQKRDGLVLGICNGFQALIKTGLVPYGEIKEMKEDMPTLTNNRIGRHVSRMVRTRLVSAISPWAQEMSVLDAKVHIIPVSHGEGRVIMPMAVAKELFDKGQVFTQYVDEEGKPTMLEPHNPNGSVCAIEGLTSADGRVLGKMGHSERTIGGGLLKNIPCGEGESLIQDIFTSGVRYFLVT